MIKLAPREAAFAKWLVELCGAEKRFSDNGVGIIFRFRAGYKKNDSTIRSLLNALEARGIISIGKGPNATGRGRYMFSSIKILREDFTDPVLVQKAIAPEPRPAKTSNTPPLPAPSGNGNLPDRQAGPKQTMAILIDFDNTVISATEAGYTFSPKKLNEYCRKFGVAEFRMAFLSPRSRGDINQHAFQLNSAGFDPVICPMYIKEKDSVDEILKEKVRQLLKYVDVIVISTADGDMKKDARFENQVLDQGKKLEYVDVKALARELAGTEGEPCGIPSESRRYAGFQSAIDIIMSGRCTLNQTEDINVKFVCEAYDAAVMVAEKRELSFRELVQASWDRLTDNRKRMFRPDDLKSLLSALNHKDIIKSHPTPRFTYYKPNPSHQFPAKRATYGDHSKPNSSRVQFQA
ncbi:MAG: hypothetical protein AAB930_00945 [Patescibacteria group bacterium]